MDFKHAWVYKSGFDLNSTTVRIIFMKHTHAFQPTEIFILSEVKFRIFVWPNYIENCVQHIQKWYIFINRVTQMDDLKKPKVLDHFHTESTIKFLNEHSRQN